MTRIGSSGTLILYTARAVRGFGDGFAIILLPAYLALIGFDSVAIGFVATAALLGTALLTLGVGAIASRHDLKNLLLAGAIIMACTGLAFPTVHHIALLGIVAFLGTINPSSGDMGVMIPLEHAMLAHRAPDDARTKMFARYSLIGALSMAAGSAAAALPDYAVALGVGRLQAFEWMFYGYAALGLLSAFLYTRLPHAQMDDAARAAPLRQSRRIVFKLAALFSVDAFAGGFVVQSLLALWLFQKFDLSLAAASVFFFCTTILSALSYPIAARLANRIGLINTMVFTHIPSSLFLIAAAFSPGLYATLALLLLRSALSQMDVPTRTSYVMAVVTPAERAAAASVTAVPRSLASSISPIFAGALLTLPFSGFPLLIAGTLKIAYDFGLLWSFRHIKPPEEQLQTSDSVPNPT
ncbi:MAG: MFS transporter [Variibacter sp.]